MNYSALIQNRKSTREFTDREITYGQLETIRNYYYNSVRRLIPEIRTELRCFGPGTGAALEGAAVVWDKGKDYITVIGVLSSMRTVHGKVTVSRLMPEMDYVIECGNRLWGCRYGTARNGQVVNEL